MAQPDLRPVIVEKFSNSLPNCWDAKGCHSNLKILGNDFLMVFYKGNGNGSSSVFTKCAFPGSEFGIFYYEMKVENVKNSVSIGLGTKTMPLYGSVGQHLDSYAYESNGTFLVNGIPYENAKYCRGDVVGIGVNLINNRIIFTKNGFRLDTAHLFLSPSSSDLLLFPCVTLSDCGDKIEANFGPNFQFDPANAKAFPQILVKINFWDVNACHDSIAISGPKCTAANIKENEEVWRNVFAKYSILHSAFGPFDIFYFEMNVKNLKGWVSFGFAVKHQTPLDQGIGGNIGTYSYLCSGIFCFNESIKCVNETFDVGDTVGCGVNLANNQVFFTKNGHRIDATNDIRISSSLSADILFPFVCFTYSNAQIEANFGPEFMFDLSSLSC